MTLSAQQTGSGRSGAAHYGVRSPVVPAVRLGLGAQQTGAGRSGAALFRSVGALPAVRLGLGPLETGAGRAGGPLYHSAAVFSLTLREAVVAFLRGL